MPRASRRVRGSARAGRDRRSARACDSRSTSWRTRARIRWVAQSTPAQLLGHVGDQLLGGVGGRRGPHVGHQVEQRRVGLVTDRGDDRLPGAGDRPHQGLVAEGQQVLDRAASTRHDDHVDLGVAVEAGEGIDHVVRRARALHRGVRRREGDARPAPAGVLHDVALGGGALGRDQTDAARKEGQRLLQLEREQALGGQQLTAALQAGQELAEPDHPDLAGDQREGAAVGVVVGLGMDHHAGALDQRRVEAVEEGAGAGHRDGDVAGRVAHGHEHRAEPRTPADLRHLPLDPHRTEPSDPARDGQGDLPHGRGRRERGLQGHGRERRPSRRRHVHAVPGVDRAR